MTRHGARCEQPTVKRMLPNIQSFCMAEFGYVLSNDATNPARATCCCHPAPLVIPSAARDLHLELQIPHFVRNDNGDVRNDNFRYSPRLLSSATNRGLVRTE